MEGQGDRDVFPQDSQSSCPASLSWVISVVSPPTPPTLHSLWGGALFLPIVFFPDQLLFLNHFQSTQAMVDSHTLHPPRNFIHPENMTQDGETPTLFPSRHPSVSSLIAWVPCPVRRGLRLSLSFFHLFLSLEYPLSWFSLFTVFTHLNHHHD